MEILSKQTQWVIMTKDRKFIAKGTPKNRYLISVDNIKDKKRYLTYSSKGRAEAGFNYSGFYGYNASINELEAVEIEMIMNMVN